MKTVVLGAGVIGVTTAYYLAREGHQVVVVEREPEPAAETSRANAGLISPGHSFTWNSPRAPGQLWQSLWSRETAYRMHFSLDPRFWTWGLKFLSQCTPARSRYYTLVKYRLNVFSQARIEEIAAAEGLRYDQQKRGLLVLFRSPKAFEEGIGNMKLIQEAGHKVEFVDGRRAVEIEPALKAIEGQIVGAVYCPTDGSGDCRKFTLALTEVCRKLGVEFRFGTTIQRIESRGGRVTGVATDQGTVSGDAYVLAAGSYSPLLARPLGLDIPVYPVKGFSLTLPFTDPSLAPQIGGVDEGFLVAYCGMGDRLRLTGTADFSGYDKSHKPEDFAIMMQVARGMFPRGVDFSNPTYWACLRPMTPDGPPIIGPTPIGNLWLNTGQGHMGWTMSAGSSRILADLMAGRASSHPTESLTFERYGRRSL
jgi:D-amino-acid dehydrogenase